MIYLFSSRELAAFGLSDKTSWAKTLKISYNFKMPLEYEIQAEDKVYLDISGLSPPELKKALEQIKKSRAGSFWGIIDPAGEAEDPALFFFECGRDYIGPGLVKKGLTKKRFAAAEKPESLQNTDSKTAEKTKLTHSEHKPALPISRLKLPDTTFEGWKSLHAGSPSPFFFLFVSVTGRSGLRSKVGESVFSAVKDRLRKVLQQALNEADALLWMETENNSLFLIPPRAPNARAAVEAGLKLIVNSRLIGIEKLGLSFPLDFTIALHYGESVFRAPGKTGSIVSEPVNYIFHLGVKKAEPGRLTISGKIPEEALPKGLADLFSSAGIFEGIPIIHSKRFVYK